jgi:tRNA-dihydrouridine synthase B
LGHLSELYDFYGEYSGCRISRKHIAWYTKGLRSSNEFRQNMYKVESTAEQFNVVEDYFKQLLAQGEIMSDVQVEKINLLETK